MTPDRESPEIPVTRDPRGPRPVSRWVVAAPSITLVLGMLLGGSLIWLTTSDDGRDAEDDPSDTSEAPPSPGTAVVVPDACLQAAETVREATELIRQGIEDVRAFRAEKVIDLLNDLEDLDTQARAEASTCADTQVTDAPLSSPPTSEPTSDPPTEISTPPSESPAEPTGS